MFSSPQYIVLKLIQGEGSSPPSPALMAFDNGDIMAYDNGDLMEYS